MITYNFRCDWCGKGKKEEQYLPSVPSIEIRQYDKERNNMEEKNIAFTVCDLVCARRLMARIRGLSEQLR